MPRLDTVWAVLLAMPAIAFANPQPVPNAGQTPVDRRQIAIDRAWNERDAREVAEFERLTLALRDAARDRMTGRYREVNERVQTAITREIEQARVKTDRAAGETHRSRGELRRERMDASMPGGGDDMFDTRDDRRDLRDDRRDEEVTLARFEEMARLGTMAAALQNPIERGERGAMKQNLDLAEHFLALMRRDLSAGRFEAGEDRVELREDRRERRSDGR
jgi:hypothetical protein